MTAPDGTRWIVGRRWLLSRPRYFGFRFGIKRKPREFEAPHPGAKPEVVRKPAPTRQPTPPPVMYRGKEPRPRRTWWWGGGSRSGRRGGRGSGWTWRGGGGGGGRSSGGGGRGGSSGGGARSGSSGGGKRGGGGGGGAAAGGALAGLVKILRWVLIVAAIIAAVLFTIFVLIPTLVFLIQYAAFWIVVGLTVAYRALSGRPWIVEMEEAEGFRVKAWRVMGWKESRGAIDAVAEAVLAGEPPDPPDAEEVELVEAA